MGKTVFYAWQSDRPNVVCRAFVEKCLSAALKSLNASVEVSPAQREEELVLDKDTKGLPGSPNIAEAILAKIDNCVAIVADLTFVAEFKRADSRSRFAPNSNVLLEYGYALKSKGQERLIGVFNTYYGEIEALPFDLRHRRSAIAYTLSPNADEAARREAFEELTEDLRKALLLIIDNGSLNAPNINISWVSGPAEEVPGRFLKNGEKLGVRDGHFVTPSDVNLSNKATCWIRIVPPVGTPSLSRAETQAHVRYLTPMFGGGSDFGRNKYGAFSFAYASDNPDLAVAVGQLFMSREIWGADTETLNFERIKKYSGVDFPFIPTTAFESRFMGSLKNYLNFMAARLAHTGRVKVVCGVHGIEGYRLAVSQRRFIEQFIGLSVENTVTHEMELDSPDTSRSEDVLLPFFEQVWDAAGVERPRGMPIGSE